MRNHAATRRHLPPSLQPTSNHQQMQAAPVVFLFRNAKQPPAHHTFGASKSTHIQGLGSHCHLRANRNRKGGKYKEENLCTREEEEQEEGPRPPPPSRCLNFRKLSRFLVEQTPSCKCRTGAIFINAMRSKSRREIRLPTTSRSRCGQTRGPRVGTMDQGS